MELDIPTTLLQELSSCVRRVAEHFMHSPSDQLRGLVQILSNEVAGTVTNVISERNRKVARDTALSADVWCEVWQRLPFASRITATHVCRSWRMTALACPLLWNDIRTTFWRSGSSYAANEIGPVLVALEALLGRASPAPTRLSLCIQKYDWRERACNYLRDLLCAHAFHIVDLRFSAPGQSGAGTLIRDVLPLMLGLRRLRLTTTDFDLRIESIVRPDARFNCLRALELDGVFFEDAADPDMFPRVEEVLLVVTQCPLTPRTVGNMFLSCPKTTRLAVHLLAGWWSEQSLDAPALDSLTSIRLERFRLAIFSPGDLYISRVLDFFQHERIPCVTVSFTYNSVHDPLSIFSDLQTPHTLILRAEAGAKALDSRGFSRQVLWDHGIPSTVAEALLARLAPSLSTFIVDATIWLPLSSPVSTPRLETIVLRLLDASELAATAHPKLFGALPALHTLRLQLVNSHGYPCIANGRHRVDVSSVLALIEALPRRVDVLQLANVKFKKHADRSPLELLRSRVASVEAVSCDAEEHHIVGDGDD